MTLIEDWKAAWKWLSVQFAALIVIAGAVYEAAPQMINPYLPGPWPNRIMLGLGVLVILGRIKKQ